MVIDNNGDGSHLNWITISERAFGLALLDLMAIATTERVSETKEESETEPTN